MVLQQRVSARFECKPVARFCTILCGQGKRDVNMLKLAVLVIIAGKRDYQQDRHIAIPDFKPNHGGHDQVSCCLVGVFDGHKSEQAAELAAAKMPGIIAARKPKYC